MWGDTVCVCVCVRACIVSERRKGKERDILILVVNKRRTKEKVAYNRAQSRRTGSGPPEIDTLSTTEEVVQEDSLPNRWKLWTA